MTNDEIRIKIAKLKGWRVYDPKDYNGQLFGTSPEGVFYSALPDWPGEMSPAWSLVEEARKAEVGVMIHNSLTILPVPDIWSYTCAFYDPIGGPHHKTYSAEAETAAMAICLAWLAWKEGDK